MAIRQIYYTVTSGGISPATMQQGGVQGDHNVTKLVFNIGSELWDSLQAAKEDEGGELIYRVDGYDALSRQHSSEVSVLTEKRVEYNLEECITRYGGMIRAVLVISHYKDEKTERELFSFPAVLQVKALPGCGEDENRESVSALAQAAKDSAQRAEAAAEEAENERILTENAMAQFDEGTEVIFLGGNAESGFEIEMAIDEQLSSESGNPVRNSTVKAELDKVNNSIAANNKDLQDYADEAAGKVEGKIGRATIKTVGSYTVTGTKFVANDPNDAPGDNAWHYIIFSNGFYICYGHFNIKPAESSDTGNDIYCSEQITVPLPFEVYVNASTATGAATNLTELSNPYVNKNTLTFKYRRCNAPISLQTTRTYLQIMGVKSL